MTIWVLRQSENLKSKIFPAVVLIDCEGNDLYEIGQAKYREI